MRARLVLFHGLLGLIASSLLVSEASARGRGFDAPGGTPRPGPVAPTPPSGRIPGSLPTYGGADREARREHLDQPIAEQSATAPTAPPTRGPAAPDSGPPAADASENVPTTVVHARRGEVHFVADLAREVLTLSIQNVGSGPVEWSRVYRIDPSAEIVGAELRRGTTTTVARTLALEDAVRIYDEVRSPRTRPRRPRWRGWRNRDPLRLERTRRSELAVHVWPVEPNETVDVVLTFLSPLRGTGAERRFVDVLEGDPGPGRADDTPRTEPTSPDRAPAPGAVRDDVAWAVHPGELVLASVPTGLAVSQADGHLAFRSRDEGSLARFPGFDLRSTTEERPIATAVPGGGIDRQVAVWRFDPGSWLAQHGFQQRPDLTLRLRPLTPGMDRMAPRWFGASDLARPVTARLRPDPIEAIEFEVEVLDRTGTALLRQEERVPLRRTRMDRDLEAAIAAWHRAMLAARVHEGARLSSDRGAHLEAVRFAVDQGVLMPGSAALAVPPRELRGLSDASRRLYQGDGVPLGSPRREADLRPLPRHLLDP